MSPRRAPVSRRDRPAKPPLSRDGVVAVALGIMREEGLERVTMRRLASELDTGPASLYVYVANTAELHGALLDELLGEMELRRDADAGTAREVLIGLISDYVRVLIRYPSLARSVLSLWPSGPNYLRLVDSALGLLATAGVPARQAAWGVDILLLHATAGAAEHGTRAESAGAGEQGYDLATAIKEIAAGDYPNIARVRGDLFAGTGEQRLRWQFAALIEGIATTGTPG